jgi:hypothetical protein
MSRRIAVYGSYEAKVPLRQRFWKKRRDGIRQRYWKTTKRFKTRIVKGRYEFYGQGNELYQAVFKAIHIVPKGFIEVSAQDILKNPYKYGFEGKWIDRKVES